MANEYASLEKLKNALRITDSRDDEDLQGRLAAASRAIDRRTGRRFWLDTEPVTRTINARGRVVRDDDGELLLLDDIGTAAGLVVDDGTAGGVTWTPVTGYETYPDDALIDGWPITGLRRPWGCWQSSATGRVRVTARWGWPAVPADVEEATVLLASRLWFRRDSPQGVAASSEWGPVRVSRFDPDVESLLEPYLLTGLA